MVGKNKVLCSISTDRVHPNVYLSTVFLHVFFFFISITNGELALKLDTHIQILFIYHQLLFLFLLLSQAWPRNSHEHTPNPVP